MHTLLALDGSAESALGLETALSLTWPSGARLLVLSVLPADAQWYGGPWAAGVAFVPPKDLMDGLRTDRERLLADAAARLRRHGLDVATHLATGRAASIIVETAREIAADLMIVGARGHGAIEEAVLGSVSAEVVDRAPCAVLVARRPSAARILLGTDGSDVAMSAATFVGGCGLFATSEVRVMHAIDVDPAWWLGYTPADATLAIGSYATVASEGRNHGEELTAIAAARLRDAGLATSTITVDGQAAAAIVDHARSWGADLVVVGTRGNGLLTRLLLGSTARSVMHRAEASVLITKPTTAVDQESAPSSDSVQAVPA
jgi:nucleotide-binding universal stress UspA family protein